MMLQYTNSNDTDIWNMFLGGKKDALQILYVKYYDLLYNYGLRIYPDKDFVKDKIQDLFVRLYTNPNLKQTEYVRAYLICSFRNILLDELTALSKYRATSLDSFELSIEDEMLEKIFNKDDNQLDISKRLTNAMSQLLANQKMIIYLRYVKGLSHKEISIILKINEQSSMNLLSRALTKLRQIMLNAKLFFTFI